MPGNWYQVFGKNPCLWLLPLMAKSGKPDGSGGAWSLKHGGGSVVENREAEINVFLAK